MKIVIDIPEMAYEAYKEWNKNMVATVEQSLIANGTPLPEMYGRLGDLISREHDREELIREKLEDIIIVKQDGKYRPVKNTSAQECYRVLFEIIKLIRRENNALRI